MCLYPRLIKNRKYTKTKKNKGVIPKLPLIQIGDKIYEDIRVTEVPVGCGKCMECKKQKAREWQVRLQEEIKTDKRGIFVTLTFSNESIKELYNTKDKLTGYNLDNHIATIATRRFLERWRKKYKKSVKHWLVTELGHNGTENIHLHGIIWTDEDPKEITRIWRYGFTWLSTDNKGYVNEKTVNYIVKYIHKTDEIHTEYKSKILTSPGIGKGYLKGINAKTNKYNGEKTKEYYKTNQGIKLGLPTYYRNKIYTENEREQLWLDKLDKEERYVNGTKVSIANGDEEYNKLRAYHRKRNKMLGYGDDKINWEKRKYEEQRRNINTIKRLKDAEKTRQGQKR